MYTNNLARARLAVLTLAAGLMASVWLFRTAGATATTANAEVNPSAASALATDEKLATAIRNNDAKGIEQLLSDDWAVVATTGGIGEGKSVFPNGIKSGFLVRTAYELSDPRVRLYGNVALVTSQIKTSGKLGGKPFDVEERQTDVLVWKNGSWKCVLTHETKIETQKMK